MTYFVRMTTTAAFEHDEATGERRTRTILSSGAERGSVESAPRLGWNFRGVEVAAGRRSSAHLC